MFIFFIFHQVEKENLRKKKHLDFLDILLEARVSVDFFHWEFFIIIRFWETGPPTLPLSQHFALKHTTARLTKQ